MLREEIERSERHGHPFCLLMLDLDQFKDVNDTHGHLAGDQILLSVAKRIRNGAREIDKVARCGGEEFAMILPETSATGARSIAECIRIAIGESPFALGQDHSIKLTISIGVTEFPQEAKDEEGLLGAADQALYAAKEGGRNRVCVSSRSGD